MLDSTIKKLTCMQFEMVGKKDILDLKAYNKLYKECSSQKIDRNVTHDFFAKLQVIDPIQCGRIASQNSVWCGYVFGATNVNGGIFGIDPSEK